MWGGGGGNKIRLCTKGGKKSAFHFFFPNVIFGNILSFPHAILPLAFLIPATAGTREEVAT